MKAFERKHGKSFSALSLVIARVFGCKSASDLKGRAEARAAWAVVGRAREVAVLFTTEKFVDGNGNGNDDAAVAMIGA